MIVNNQMYSCTLRNLRDGVRHSPDLVEAGRFGSQLNEIRPAVTQLLGYFDRRTASEVHRVNEGIQTTLGKWLLLQ
jgi:hypothetical protein